MRDAVSMVPGVEIKDPRSRWVPPLGPVGSPGFMNNSTKGDLYTYIQDTTTWLTSNLNSIQR